MQKTKFKRAISYPVLWPQFISYTLAFQFLFLQDAFLKAVNPIGLHLPQVQTEHLLMTLLNAQLYGESICKIFGLSRTVHWE